MRKISLLFLISLSINGVFGDEVKSVSVMEGDSVTLHTDITEIQRDDLLNWIFNKDDYIAQINNKVNLISIYDDVLDGRFRDRLQVNNQTGDLTITNITTQHTGDYHLEINGEKITGQTFSVSVIHVDPDEMKSVSVMEGDSVTLHTDVLDIKKYDVIQWRFQHENSLLAELNRKTAFFSTFDDVHDGRFKGRLQLNVQTGSLTITNIRNKHAGLYEVDISNSSSHTIHQSITVTVSGKVTTVSVIKGDWVTLKTNTEIQTYDLIQWMFAPDDDTRIAEIYKSDNTFAVYDGADGRFRDRLMLNNQTGYLTIINIRTEDAGLYELKMSSSRRSIQRRFSVNVSERGLSSYVIAGLCFGVLLVSVALTAGVFYCRQRFPKATIRKVMVGRSVRLKTDVDNIETDDVIEWRFKPGPFRNNVIAKIQRNNLTAASDERLCRNMTLNKRTGSLYITDITADHSGSYELKITSGVITSYKRFKVIVSDFIPPKDLLEISFPLMSKWSRTAAE
ncbi:uncharacterized protein [Paramisgurnus dabryanus]|uniref:uncharacterized protein n=1 Tax=Paramisgurnus dabryanus TaxID=90735 RepID=UPI0031F3ECB0